MKLIEYLDKYHMKRSLFAKELGVSSATMHRWVHNKARPLLIYRKKIEEITEGSVKVSDWNEPKEEGKPDGS